MNIAKIYYELIKKGRKTIDEVPEAVKAEVEALIEADKE